MGTDSTRLLRRAEGKGGRYLGESRPRGGMGTPQPQGPPWSYAIEWAPWECGSIDGAPYLPDMPFVIARHPDGRVAELGPFSSLRAASVAFAQYRGAPGFDPSEDGLAYGWRIDRSGDYHE